MKLLQQDKIFTVETEGEPIRISGEVLATVAGIAAADVEGVAGLCESPLDFAIRLLGKKRLSAGVRVDEGEKGLIVSLSIIVAYGHSAPAVAARVQREVISAVDSMTGVPLAAVNVTVADVRLPR